MNNISFAKFYSIRIIYILFSINVNKLIFWNFKLWSMFNLSTFADTTITISKILVIIYSRFVYNNESYIINKSLSCHFFLMLLSSRFALYNKQNINDKKDLWRIFEFIESFKVMCLVILTIMLQFVRNDSIY